MSKKQSPSTKKASSTTAKSNTTKSTAKSTKTRAPKSSTAKARTKISVEEIDFENPQAVQDFYDQEGMLSEKEVLFCLQYIENGMIAKHAYAKVFNCENLKTCAVEASKLLRKPKLKLFLRRELDQRAQRLGVTSDWVAYKYKVWSEAFIGDFVEVKEFKVKGVTTQVLLLKSHLEDLTPEQRSCIKSVEPTKDGHIKVTLIDQKAALDSLSKMLGYTNDKLKIEAEGTLILKFDDQDKDA